MDFDKLINNFLSSISKIVSQPIDLSKLIIPILFKIIMIHHQK